MRGIQPERTTVRYATITAAGVLLDGESESRSVLVARIVAVSPSRSLYREGRLLCRSLDGAWNLAGRRACPRCPEREACTPQARLDLAVDGAARGRIDRLLLAYTNREQLEQWMPRARGATGRAIVGMRVRLTVEPRESRAGRPWGRLVFEVADATAEGA